MAISQQQFFGGKIPTQRVDVLGNETAIQKDEDVSGPNFFQRVGEQYKKAGDRITKGIQDSSETISSGINKIGQGDILGGAKDVFKGEARAGLRTVGSIAGAAFAPILEAPGVKQGVEAIVGGASKIPAVQQLASKGMELAQKYPNASKDIEDFINIATLGLGQAATKPIQNIVTDSAKSIGTGASNIAKTVTSKAKGLLPESETIMNRVARLKPTDAKEFERLAGKTHGDYLVETGNFGSPDKIITKEAEKFTQSLNDVDNEIAKLPGLYKNGGVDDMLTGLLEKAKNTSGDNVQSPYLQQVIELNNKNLGDGLSMEDINAVKRLYEREVKLSFKRDITKGDEVKKATYIDDAVREWQIGQAERLGFTNLKELNKQTQLSKFIVNKLGDQVVGQTGLNGIGLTDWIMLSGGDPTAVSGFLVKKFFSDKGIQSRIAKMLNKGEIKGQIKPEVKPINYNPLQLGEPSIKLPAKTDTSSVSVIQGKNAVPEKINSSKPQSPQSPKIQSEKALPKASTTSPIKSSPKVKGTIPENTLISEAKKYKSAEEFVKAQGEPIYHGTNKSFDLKDAKPGDRGMYGSGVYFSKEKGNAHTVDGNNVLIEGFFGKDSKIIKDSSLMENTNKILDELGYKGERPPFVTGVPDKEMTDVLKKAGYDGIELRNNLGIGGKTKTNYVVFSPEKMKTKSQLTDTWNKANKNNSDDALINEAKKYKSADEFVKAQGETVYRGGKELSDKNITDAGVSVASHKKIAEDFVKQKGGTVSEYKIRPEAKIVDFQDVPNVKFKNLNDYSPELDTGDKQIWRDLEVEYQKAINWAKQNGYDAVKLPLEREVRVINPDVLKTKSQLTDIWKKANK